MDQIISLWDRFISIFPGEIRVLVSIGIFIGLVVLFIDLIKRNILWILLLIIFIPASIPILSFIWEATWVFLSHILP